MNKFTLFIIVWLGLAGHEWRTTPYTIECPKLECGVDAEFEPSERNVCFMHDTEVPTKKLTGIKCQYWQDRYLEFNERIICEFDLLTEQYAWVQEYNQHLSGSTNFKPYKEITDGGSSVEEQGHLKEDMSPMKDKRTTSKCRTYTALNNNKMAGRNCTEHNECITMKCNKEKGQCEGRLDTHTCFSHADCDAPFFCSKEVKYPYLSTCKLLKTSYAPCTESNECLHTLYCWYADIKESPINGDGKDSKQCLPMYSQEKGKSFGWNSDNFDDKLAGKIPWEQKDFEMNGKYCNTGLAFLFHSFENKEKQESRKYQSVCGPTKKIMQGDKVLEYPYECDPTDNAKPCIIYPENVLEPDKGEVVTEKFEVPCKCALDGKKGYCSSIIGTEQYKDGSSSQYLQREKSRCHTLDRDNYISWLDCSTETNMDNIQGAIDWSFNLTHWPYIHDAEVKNCISEISRRSWKNIQALKSSRLEFRIVTFVVTVLASYSLFIVD